MTTSSTAVVADTTPDHVAVPRVPTRWLLAGGALAAPLWVGASLAQVATREGFDLTRHPLSALSNGELGWLQITNFVVAGVLLLAGATGLRRAMRAAPGSLWVPRLVRTSGVGMVLAGLLVMDPAGGFPAGAPDGMPATMSWPGIGHLVAGTVTFTALIAVCYVLVRHFRAAARPDLAIGAGIAGTALLLGNGWAMVGGRAGTLTLAIGAMAAMLFVSFTAAWHGRRI